MTTVTFPHVVRVRAGTFTYSDPSAADGVLVEVIAQHQALMRLRFEDSSPWTETSVSEEAGRRAFEARRRNVVDGWTAYHAASRAHGPHSVEALNLLARLSVAILSATKAHMSRTPETHFRNITRAFGQEYDLLMNGLREGRNALGGALLGGAGLALVGGVLALMVALDD